MPIRLIISAKRRTIEVTGFSSEKNWPLGKVMMGVNPSPEDEVILVRRHLTKSEARAFHYARWKGVDVVQLGDVPKDFPTQQTSSHDLGLSLRKKVDPTPPLQYQLAL